MKMNKQIKCIIVQNNKTDTMEQNIKDRCYKSIAGY